MVRIFRGGVLDERFEGSVVVIGPRPTTMTGLVRGDLFVRDNSVCLRSIFSRFISPTANSCRYGIRFPTIRFSAFRRCSSYVERLTPRLRAMFSVVTSRGEV